MTESRAELSGEESVTSTETLREDCEKSGEAVEAPSEGVAELDEQQRTPPHSDPLISLEDGGLDVNTVEAPDEIHAARPTKRCKACRVFTPLIDANQCPRCGNPFSP